MNPIQERKLISLITDDPSCVLLMKNKYITDNMWKTAIHLEPSLFQYMKDPSNEMCLYALMEDGHNLQYILNNPNIRLTTEMAYAAVASCPSVIFDVPANMRDNDIKEFAIDNDPTLLKYFSNIRKEYIDRKLRQDPCFARFLENPTEDMICKALISNPYYCTYVEKFTPRMKQIMEELYPNFVQLLRNRGNY